MLATPLRPSLSGSRRTDKVSSGIDPQTSVREELNDMQQNENKIHGGDIPEFEAAGTELGKEARIWKVYVEQSDRWDAELVDGWNKSLDVILVFAALFSAISTAFIIESSKGLRKDPPDATAQALILVSQNLLSIIDNTHQLINTTRLQSNFSNATDIPQLNPSGTNVLINAVWYLSLTLSVLTSFMAMLAKDWCHSFMAGRTGHAHSQTRRRQQKWRMIEKWKMQELLIVLPSLIHLSLLLFTVGLCVYVWELNVTVAIPVVCVAALAVSFYAWSSVTATLVDFFPYTTIISRVLLSHSAKYCYTTLDSLLQYIWPLVRIIPNLGAQCLLLVLDFLYNYTARQSRSWKKFLKNQRDDPRQWASGLFLVPAPKSSRQIDNSGEDNITSLALGWLISNCEEPSAVDAALQAISGASHLDRVLLEESNAALEISRRLVSEDIYKPAHSPRVLLYARALSYLNPNKSALSSTLTGARNTNPGEREVLIRSLQYANDNRVANLITDGRFMPTPPNFEALRIGCTSATQVITHLDKGHLSGSDLSTKLLEEYVEDKQLLHPAALLALANSEFAFAICFPDPTRLNISGLALKLLHDKVPKGLFSEPQLEISLVSYIILGAELALPQYSQRNPHHREDSLHQVIKRLAQWSHNEKVSIWLGISVISSNPEIFTSKNQSRELGELRKWAISSYHSTFECLPRQHDSFINRVTTLGHLDNLINHAAVLEHLETLQEMYSSVVVGTPIPQIYYLVVESMCRDRSSGYGIWSACCELLSKFRFPALSTELADWLVSQERDIIPLLLRSLKKHKKHTIKFLAASQLWHMFILCSGETVGERPEQGRLKSQLLRFSVGAATARWGRDELELEIVRFWKEGQAQIERSLGAYAYRILECLQDPPIEREEVERWLHDTPRELRGLCSFAHHIVPDPALLPDESRHSGSNITDVGSGEALEMV